MRIRYSLTTRILLLVTATLLVGGALIYGIANRHLLAIVDRGQEEIYREKVEAICAQLARADERLRKTGLVEAYREDFQTAVLKDLRELYYQQGDSPPLVYPFIVSTDGRTILHPVQPLGDLSLVGTDLLTKLLATPEGDFDYTYQGVEKWCYFKQFEPWNWIVGYAVPRKLKYADARRVGRMLLTVMAGVGGGLLLLLALMITRFTRPVSRLTAATAAMAAGDLEREIEIRGHDEVGTLARSFLHMRDAVRRTISRLEGEVAERRKAEEALAVEKERLFVTLRSIGDGVISTDTETRVVLMNRAAEELTGWHGEEAVGRPLAEVLPLRYPDDEGGACVDPAREVIGDGQIHDFGHRLLTNRHGGEIHVTDSAAPIIGPDSGLIGVVLVFRDITEQLRNEEELRKLGKLESVGVLAGGIAHDFNNILAAILGNIGLALTDDSLPADLRHSLAEAEKASLRAKDLTQQLLTFAKGGEPVKETASIAEVIRDSAAFVLHGDRVACEFDIPDDLWLVEIDRGQISQVIQNLVLNAGQAMTGGGVVRICCANLPAGDCPDFPGLAPGNYVRIIVEDTGPGIPAAVLDNIFDPYFTTKEKGSGLGLAITHSIIVKHGGWITAASPPGKGAVFTICLPAAADQDRRREAPQGKESAAAVRAARVLLMDDDEMVRGVAGAMLRQLGHEVAEAVDGEEAIAMYRQAREAGTPYDVVIVDLTVPGGMGGQEAVAVIRDEDPAVKAVVSSGYSNDPVMAHYRDYGFAAAISKPYQLREIQRVLADVL